MEPGPKACLSRREFVRRAAIGAMAAAAAGRVVGGGPGIARAAEPDGGGVPTLAVDQPVTGVAAARDGLVAVGGSPGDPRIWSLTFGAEAWRLAADASAFPHGTCLTAVCLSNDEVIAAGWLREPSGPRPAAFRSPDAARWSPVDPGLGSIPGSFTAIAEIDGQVLAVGARFAEPQVGEPVAPIAAIAAADGTWSPSVLDGVDRIVHGAVTLLARVPDGLLLAVTDVAGLSLYQASGPRSSWRRVTAPRLDGAGALVAATALGERTVLAGIDALDRARFWLGGANGWREVRAPASLSASARVMGLARRGDSLVAAEEGPRASFVEEVAIG